MLSHTQSNSSEQTVFDFFYVVVTVFPSNDECLTTQQGFVDSLVTLETADNYNPAPYTEGGRGKNVTILVEPALSCKWGGRGGERGRAAWWCTRWGVLTIRGIYLMESRLWAGLRESLCLWCQSVNKQLKMVQFKLSFSPAHRRNSIRYIP